MMGSIFNLDALGPDFQKQQQARTQSMIQSRLPAGVTLTTPQAWLESRGGPPDYHTVDYNTNPDAWMKETQAHTQAAIQARVSAAGGTLGSLQDWLTSKGMQGQSANFDVTPRPTVSNVMAPTNATPPVATQPYNNYAHSPIVAPAQVTPAVAPMAAMFGSGYSDYRNKAAMGGLFGSY